MTTRHVRRTVRSAGLMAVAAAAAFSLTACQSGSDGAAAGSREQISGSASPSTGDSGASSGAKSAADKVNKAREAGKTEGGTQATAIAVRRTTAPPATAKAAAPIRTQTLVDGSKAKIYRLGTQHYRADIVNDGQILATLETKQYDAGLDGNGMFVVLTLGGEIHSWMSGEHQGPGTFHLAGGWKAKVTKIGELRYRAQILGHDGEVDATLEADQHDVGLDANGVYIVLSAGGVISAHE